MSVPNPDPMPLLPSTSQLLRVFAKTEHFGLIADTPFGCGYLLHDLKVAVSFFGHQVFFCYGDAVLIFAHEINCKLDNPDAADNLALLRLIDSIDAEFTQ